MKSKLISVLALLVLASCASCRKAPVFSSAYSVTGSLYLPYAELLEPFNAWYNADDQLSRIDYYQGAVKTYHTGTDGEYGSTVEIVPVTTETQTNVATCFKNYGENVAGTVTPQSLLPDITNFTYVGTEVKNGYQCEIWREIVKSFERTSTYTIWIRWQKNPTSPSLSEPIPVRYEMKGYNSLIGSHYDHYYLDYDNFVLGKPDPDVFKVAQNINCDGNNAQHDHHVYHFNPMKEFVDRHTGHVDDAWEKYKTVHSKSYDNQEHDERKDIFRHNLRYIHSTNRQGLGFTVKVNHLADRSDGELRAIRGRQYKTGYNGGDAFPYNADHVETLVAAQPQDFDWRIRGAVTPVKDQATCGSCWSFGSTGSIEGAYFLKTGHLVSLSQQALVDCSWGFGNNGCDGGLDYQAYQWIQKHGGIPSDEDYGYYRGQDGYCHIDTVNLIANIASYVNVTSGDENALRVAIFNHGPISVSIDASHKSFSFYSHGLYFEKSCSNQPDGLDHSVLAVGYGSLNGKNYWLIKNSWSNHWGDQGYVLMSSEDNNCGVETEPTYVNLA